jgi:hypothetical protein
MDWLLFLIIVIIIFTGILLYTIFCNCRCEDGKNICGIGFFWNFNFIGNILIVGLILGLLIYFTIFITKKEDKITPPVPPPLEEYMTYTIDVIDINENAYLNIKADYIIIDWDDGTIETYENIDNTLYHTYENIGKYIVKFKNYKNLNKIELSDPDVDFFNNKIIDINFVYEIGTLNYLSFLNNQVKYIDTTKIKNLTYLDCSNNIFETLDVSMLTKLQTLVCAYNNISVLDASNLIYLEILKCGFNNISTLDVSNLIQLRNLTCENNNDISILNTSDLEKLEVLTCQNNNISSLNLSKCIVLGLLNCSYNNFDTIDILNCVELDNFNCSFNNISSLDINGIPISFINCSNNQIDSFYYDNTGSAPVQFICNNNKLNTNQINDYLNFLDISTINAGFFNSQNQTPPAPPSSGPPDGITAKANLISKGWTVLTD